MAQLFMTLQESSIFRFVVTRVALVLLDALVELDVHLQTSVLSKRGVAPGVRTFVGFVSCVGSQVSEKAEHAFVNGSALVAVFEVLAPEYLVVLLDSVLHAEVVHHEVSALRDVAFELEHLLVELLALDSGYLELL